MRHVARALCRLGYVVVPLGRDKRPLVKWGRYHVDAPTRADLGAMPWEAACGVGVITGRPHGLVAVDADDGPSWTWAQANLPALRGTLTRRGGHLHFRHPDRGIIGNRTGSRAIVVDGSVRLEVKGLGGLITAPGSIHPSGIRYRAYGDWTSHVQGLPVLPPRLAELAEDRPASPPPPPPPRRDHDPMRAVECYLRKVGGLPEVGCGSDAATFRAAAWAKHHAPEMREDEFVAAVRRERPEWDERWIASKWRSAGRGR